MLLYLLRYYIYKRYKRK